MGGSVSIDSVDSNNPQDMIFQSPKLTTQIKCSQKDVKKGYDDFSQNESTMKILSWQATSISRQDAQENLTTWETNLKLNRDHYSDLQNLHDAVEDEQKWPDYVDKDKPWEAMQQKEDKTNWLYFYVRRTDRDEFNMAICHFITGMVGKSQYVVIGGLCKKGLLRKDDHANIYLKFECE